MLTTEQITLLASKGYNWPEHSVQHRNINVGDKYNNLTVLAIVRNKPYTIAKALCICDCGNTTFVQSSSLPNNMTKSCGCAYSKNSGKVKHGLSHLGIWKTWHNMVDRCTNKSHPSYSRYSKLGLIEDWLDFNNFYTDMKDGWFEGAHLDRIDNSKGYCVTNVQWLTPSEHMTKTKIDLKELKA